MKIFFKPTALYKEYMLLDLIEKKRNYTQRKLSHLISASPSMVNWYIDDFERKGYLKRKKITLKKVHYIITRQGVERRKVLNISFLKNSLFVYKLANRNITDFLNQIKHKGFKDILLYGAGDVAEIFLQTLINNNDNYINIHAIIDDDNTKYSKKLVNLPIISLNDVNKIKHDGIFISSYNNRKKILKKLQILDYPRERIIQFFD